ncbi:YggS family pyridoxal phosphate-dependent enzyme [Helicobacter cholecystus]|uniref:Pyridoxal phosphate homeostasis protein n=1 Tax=Helicobacter cholecystus TaxID=45498 RepID=A0A3D8IUE0_9HELI|nr:YggS family pyridoxal phosphate-dependent enzyme [Helicobacter cholecystus]RDU68897.1 YggS family pyridoxal phosphate-dependent enzyme [Helicobacter cholecystus]VEJ25847.1 YggS family pyridoxal phosphate enzyme [Helicobacter cholecystus]
MNHLQEVIAKIEKARIAYSRHQVIKLVAVSKYWDTQQIVELYNEGQRAFGENKVQDLKAKCIELENYPLEWHLIGTIQENKINTIISLAPSLIHSIDSLKLALAFNQRLEREGKTQRVLLQINSAREQSKSGVRVEEAREVYLAISERCPNLLLEGVMSIGAHTEDKKRIAQSFEITKNIFDSLPHAKTLSMGMSGDYELAISYGANLLRIGSALV